MASDTRQASSRYDPVKSWQVVHEFSPARRLAAVLAFSGAPERDARPPRLVPAPMAPLPNTASLTKYVQDKERGQVAASIAEIILTETPFLRAEEARVRARTAGGDEPPSARPELSASLTFRRARLQDAAKSRAADEQLIMAVKGMRFDDAVEGEGDAAEGDASTARSAPCVAPAPAAGSSSSGDGGAASTPKAGRSNVGIEGTDVAAQVTRSVQIMRHTPAVDATGGGPLRAAVSPTAAGSAVDASTRVSPARVPAVLKEGVPVELPHLRGLPTNVVKKVGGQKMTLSMVQSHFTYPFNMTMDPRSAYVPSEQHKFRVKVEPPPVTDRVGAGGGLSSPRRAAAGGEEGASSDSPRGRSPQHVGDASARSDAATSAAGGGESIDRGVDEHGELLSDAEEDEDAAAATATAVLGAPSKDVAGRRAAPTASGVMRRTRLNPYHDEDSDEEGRSPARVASQQPATAAEVAASGVEAVEGTPITPAPAATYIDAQFGATRGGAEYALRDRAVIAWREVHEHAQAAMNVDAALVAKMQRDFAQKFPFHRLWGTPALKKLGARAITPLIDYHAARPELSGARTAVEMLHTLRHEEAAAAASRRRKASGPSPPRSPNAASSPLPDAIAARASAAVQPGDTARMDGAPPRLDTAATMAAAGQPKFLPLGADEASRAAWSEQQRQAVEAHSLLCDTALTHIICDLIKIVFWGSVWPRYVALQPLIEEQLNSSRPSTALLLSGFATAAQRSPRRASASPARKAIAGTPLLSATQPPPLSSSDGSVRVPTPAEREAWCKDLVVAFLRLDTLLSTSLQSGYARTRPILFMAVRAVTETYLRNHFAHHFLLEVSISEYMRRYVPRVDLGKLVSDMTRRAARRKSAPTTTSVPDQAKDGCPGVDSGHALQHAAADVVGNAPAATEEDANVGEVVSARQASPSMRSLRTCSGVASPHALTMRGGGLSRSRRALTDMQASYCTTGTNDASSDGGDDVKEEEGARPPSPTSHHRHRSGSWSARGAHAGERSPLRVGSARSHVSRRTASAHSPSRQPPSSDHASPALHTRDGSSQSPTPRSANNELLVMLTSWWPTPAEVDTTLAGLVDPGRFTSRIASLETSHSAQMELPRSRHELRRTKLINRIAQQLEKDMRASPRTARSGTRARRAAGAGAHRGNVLVQADVHPARACTASPAMVATHGGAKASSQSLAADASESVGPHVDALCTRAASRLAALDAQAYARTATTARASAANSGWAVHADSLSMDELLLPGSSSHSHSASARGLTRSATRRGEAAVPHNLHLRLDSLFLDAPRTGNDTRIGSLLSMDTVGDAVPAAAPDPSLATGAALHLSHPVRVHDTFFAVSPATAYVIPDPSSAFARRILHAPGTASSMVQHNSDVALHAAAAHDGVPIRLETEAAGVASLPPFCAPQVITDDMQQGRSGGKGAAATAAAVASSLPALSGGSGGSALSRTANVVPSLSEAHRKEVVDALWQKIIHRYTVLEKHRLAPDFVALLDFLIAGHMHGQAASEAHVPGATVSSLSSLDLGVDGLPRSPALPARTASRSLRWQPRSRGDGSASGSSARAFDSTMATQGGSVMHDVPSAQEEALNDIYGYLQQLHMQHVCLPSAFVVTPQHGHAAVNRAAEFMETIRAERMAATKQSATATAAMNAALNLAQAMGAGQGGTGVDGAAATGVSHFPAGDKAVVTGGAGTPPSPARTAAVTYPSPFGSMEGIAAGGAIPWAGPHADGAPSAGGAGALLAAERRVVIQAPTTVNLSVPTRTPASSLPSAQRRGVAWVQRAFGSASSPLLGRTPVYEPEEPAQASVSLLSPPPSTRPAPGKPPSSVHLSPLHVRNALVASLPPRRGARSPPPPMVTLADVPEAVYALELSREAFNLPPAPKWLQQASSGKFKVGSISVPTASRTTSAYAQVLSSGPLLSSATISNLRTSTASLPTRSQHRSSRR